MEQQTHQRYPDDSLTRASAARRARTIRSCLAAVALLGCTGSEVSLGAGEPDSEPAGGACGGGVFEGDVRASDQAALEALRGCQEITGDLFVLGFEGIDLTALSELRIVRGDVGIGVTNPRLPSGTIPSLDGLQSLEQVSSLALGNLSVEDLSALSGLRRIALDPLGPGSLVGGELSIVQCDRLVDLTGLESLTDFTRLALRGNASLASLAGLRVPGTMDAVFVSRETALKDLGALAPLRTVNILSFTDTGLQNLDGLQLQSVNRLVLSNNDRLEQADSLSSIQSLDRLDVVRNDRLQALPDWSEAGSTARVSIVGNAELRFLTALSLGAPSFTIEGSAAEEAGIATTVFPGFELFEVGDNPKLERIEGILFANSGSNVAIYGNQSLTYIDFIGLSRLSALQLIGNPALADVWVLHLEEVAALEVRDNPLLPSAEFAAVQTFRSELSGNLDTPAAVEAEALEPAAPEEPAPEAAPPEAPAPAP